MDTFLWWSGVAFWVLLSSIGTVWGAAVLIEAAIKYFGFYKTIMQFAWDRARAAAKQRVGAG